MADENWQLRDVPWIDIDELINDAGISIQDMADHYAALVVVAAAEPDVLTLDQWTMLGAYSRDRRIVGTATDVLEANNLNPSEFLGQNVLSDFASYKRNDGEYDYRDRMFAVAIGSQSKPPLAGNVFAEVALDTAAFALGIGIASKVGTTAIKAVAGRIMAAKVVEGSLTASIFALGATGKAAVAASRVARVAGWITKRAAYATAGSVTALGIYDLRQAMTADPQQQIDVVNRSVAEARFQRMGGRIDTNVNAAGEDLAATGERVYTDADGNVISYEEMLKLTGDPAVPMVDIEPSGLAPGVSAAGEPTGPESTFNFTTGQPAPNAPVDLQAPGFLSGAFDPTELAKQSPAVLRAARDNGDLTEAQFQQVMAARERLEQAELNELMNRQFAENPYAGGLSQDYWRSQYGSAEEAEKEAADLKSKGVPHTVVQAYRKAGRPLYHVRDIEETVANMGTIKLLAFQEQAIAAGLIDPESVINNQRFRPGLVDSRTFEAMGLLQGLANMQGDRTTWQEMLDNLEATYEEPKSDRRPWVPSRAYFTPDFARISQGIDDIFARELGRDPNGWEAELLAQEYRNAHRAGFDQEMAAEQFLYDAEGRAIEDDVAIKPPTYEEIDPWARAMETFDSQFSNEMDAKQRWADVRSKTSNLFGSLDTISRT